MSSTILGRKTSLHSLRRLHARTRTDLVTVCDGDNPNGRGGQGPPVLLFGGVECDAKPLNDERATEWLGERLRHQHPRAFFFAHDQTLPEQLYVQYQGVLYREEVREENDVRILAVCVKAERQDTAAEYILNDPSNYEI